jgi:hypothetical protein
MDYPSVVAAMDAAANEAMERDEMTSTLEPGQYTATDQYFVFIRPKDGDRSTWRRWWPDYHPQGIYSAQRAESILREAKRELPDHDVVLMPPTPPPRHAGGVARATEEE